MAREIKLKIILEGNVEDEIEDISSGLSEMDKIHAKNAKDALDRIDRTTLNQIKSQVKSAGDSLKNFGDSVVSVGKKLTVALTTPIVAATYAIGKFGLNMDGLRNQLIAFEGSSEKAEFRLKSLRSLVDQTSGATRTSAYEIYGLLKPLEASDKAIDKTIAALGRLKLGFKNMIPGDFAYNLTQIFGQNFEEQDIKQAIGQVPNFRQYLVKAFGTGDNETLSEMKKSGKITMESFFIGIADAIQNDTVLAGLQEPVALRMQKFIERAFEAVEPIANKIVDVLAQAIGFATPYLQKFSDWFKSLSPYMQNVVIASVAFAAALGPVLAVLGSLIGFFAPIITGLGTLGVSITAAGGLFAFLGTAIGTLGTFITSVLLPALIGLAPVFLVVGTVLAVTATAVIALYAAWETNFAGIRDITFQVWEAVKSVTATVLGYINGIVQTVGGQIVSWWKENYPLIKEIVSNVSESIKGIVSVFLSAIQSFWETHGERIISFVKTYWNIITSVISETINTITGIIRFALQVINGNWSDAWQTLLGIFQSASKNLVIIWKGAHDLFIKALAALIPIVTEYGVKLTLEAIKWTTKISIEVVKILATLPVRIIQLIPQFISAGVSIIGAIWKGIKEGWANSAQSDSLNIPINFSGDNTPTPLNYDRPQDMKAAQQTKTLFDSLDSESKKKAKERAELAKRELSAQIDLYRNQLSGVEKLYDEAFKKITDAFKESNDPKQFEASFDQLKSWYGEQLNTIIPLWENLVRQQTLTEKKGQNERQLAYEESQKVIEQLTQKTFDKEAQFEELKKQAQLKASADYLKNFEDTMNRATQLREAGNATDIKQIEYDVELGLATESDAINRRNLLELDSLNFRKEQLNKYLQAVIGNAEKVNDVKQQIALLDQQITQQQIENSQRLLDKKTKEQEKQNEILKNYQSLANDLSGEIQKLNVDLGLSAELSRADAIAKQLQGEAYKNLTPEMKNLIQAKAEEIDSLTAAKKAQEEYKKAFDKTADVFEDALTKISEGNWKGLFDGIFQQMRRFLVRAAAEWLASKFFKLISGGAATSSNGTGGGLFPSQLGGGSPSSGGIGGLLGSLLGIRGNSPGGTPTFAGSNFADSSNSEIQRTIQLRDGSTYTAGGSNGLNSLFGEKGFGFNSGTIGGLAGIATVAGGLLGGKVGGLISNVGSGALLGLQFGGPVGAAIGAAGGFLMSIFGGLFGSKKRKADKKENLPALQKVFTDALAQLRELAADKNNILRNPQSILDKANEIRTQIAAGGGVVFQSKKYKKIAQQQIAQKLTEADALIAEINKTAKIGFSAKDLEGRIIPEFASGNYFTGRDDQLSEMMKLVDMRRGYIAGGQIGVDRHLGYFADGEAIINQQHQANINRAAGFDVLAEAGIPNYPSKPKQIKGYAEGNFFGTTSNTPSAARPANQEVLVTVNLYQDKQGNWKAEAESEDGQKTIAKIVEKKFEFGEIKLKKF